MVDPAHPLGCPRQRIPDRVVCEHVVEALVPGSGDERIATQRCSDRTIRRRLKTWAHQGIAQQLHTLCRDACDRMLGLQLGKISIDGAITTAPCGGEKAGRSPVDRGTGGLKRSVAVEATGQPLGLSSAAANRHDAPLVAPTLHHRRQHVTRLPAPIQAGARWVVERLHSWMHNDGTLHRCTDHDSTVIDFSLHLAAALVTVRRLLPRARTHYRWPTRPTTRRLT